MPLSALRMATLAVHARSRVILQVSEVSGPGHFKATSNERVNLMYKEANDFARRLQKCCNQIKAVESATSGRFRSRGRIQMKHQDTIASACIRLASLDLQTL